MKFINFLYILFLIIWNSSLALTSNSKLKVIAVVEITRHGARSPLVDFRERKDLYFGSKKAQLTINGLRQQILLGRWIRRRYIEGDEYKLYDTDINKLDPREINIISSGVQRTIFSAGAFIQGMFPEAIIKPNFIGHPKFKMDDIPPIYNYHSDKKDGKMIKLNVIEENDNLFNVRFCKRKGSKLTIKDEMVNKDLFDITEKEYKLAIDDIVENYNTFFKSKLYLNQLKNLKYTAQTLKILNAFVNPVLYHQNLKLNLHKETFQTLKKGMLNRFYKNKFEDSVNKKLLSSRMFHMILNLFRRRIQGKALEKMLIFVSHDHNIINFISNLFSSSFLKKKIYSSLDNKDDLEFLLPPLASSLLIELIAVEGEKDYFIRLLYNGVELKSQFGMDVEYYPNLGLLSYNDFRKLMLSQIDFSFKTLDCRQNKMK